MKRIIVGITGASGTRIGIRAIEALGEAGAEAHVVVSRWGLRTLAHEMDLTLDDVRARAAHVYPTGDMGAAISSGSHPVDGMLIAPCTMRSLAAIATGLGENLIHRAADVTLKERRKLVLVARETPLSEIHLEHMLRLTRMGAVVMPPNPAFYNRPAGIDEIVDQFVARALDQFGIDVDFAARWQGTSDAESTIVHLGAVESADKK